MFSYATTLSVESRNGLRLQPSRKILRRGATLSAELGPGCLELVEVGGRYAVIALPLEAGAEIIFGDPQLRAHAIYRAESIEEPLRTRQGLSLPTTQKPRVKITRAHLIVFVLRPGLPCTR